MARRTTPKTEPEAEELAVAVAAPPKEVEDKEDAAEVEPLDRKTFIDRVVERSGEKRSNVKRAAEAALSVLLESLSKGESLALGQLGRYDQIKRVERPNGETLTVKIRVRGANAAEPKETAAE